MNDRSGIVTSSFRSAGQCRRLPVRPVRLPCAERGGNPIFRPGPPTGPEGLPTGPASPAGQAPAHLDPALADAVHAGTLPAGGIPAVPGEAPARLPVPPLLAEQLAGCALHRATGVLRVTGEPGGAVHLADGQITAISTPGAPDRR